ncbi:MAG: glutamate 5-kinase [Actinomycetota bacterium]
MIKVGSAVVTKETGRLDHKRLAAITEQIADLKAEGNQVMLVTSGAIAAGLERLGSDERPSSIPELQAAASVGQGLLLQQYTGLFEERGIHVGQVLLTQYDITHREHYLNATNTFEKLLDFGVVPIVNENDTTVVEEIKFGDNDTLAALVTNLTKADLLVIISDIEGLHTADPRKDGKAKLIAEVEDITPEIEKLAGGAGSVFGSGGMITKINAAKIVTLAGAGMLLIDGRKANALTKAMRGDNIGTFFKPRGKKMASRKAWIAFGTVAKGTITIDDGAKDALIGKGRSLLPAGVIGVGEDFEDGDTVDVVDREGNVVAKGLVNLNSGDLVTIMGRSSDDIRKIKPELAGREVIHRDCLVILK